MGDEDQMQHLRDMERRIRASVFWQNKPEGAEEAVKRLYRTGAGDCDGADWPPDASPEEISVRLKAELTEARQFEGCGRPIRNWRSQPTGSASTSRTSTAGDPAFSLGDG